MRPLPRGDTRNLDGGRHSKMIQAATSGSVKGDFLTAALELNGRRYRLRVEDGRYFITESYLTGREREHQVQYTLGSRRIQHYLTTVENGRIIVLPPTWDVQRREWFDNADIVGDTALRGGELSGFRHDGVQSAGDALRAVTAHAPAREGHDVHPHPSGRPRGNPSQRSEIRFQLATDLRAGNTIRVPAGSRLRAIAHYDNSARNRYNPAPDKAVSWSQQSTDEMFSPEIRFTYDDIDLTTMTDRDSGVLLR